MICPCCMEEHEPQIKILVDAREYNGKTVTIETECTYCPIAEELYVTEEQMDKNWQKLLKAQKERENDLPN